MESRYRTALFSAIAVLVSLGVSAVMMLSIGKDPLNAYYWLFYGAFGGVGNVGLTLRLATPLILTGLSAGIAFKAGFFSIGQEGQLLIGALLATSVGLVTGGLPFPIPMILGLLMGFVGGAVWAIFPALLKVKLGINEIISTLMMNFVATYLVLYLVSGPMHNPGDINNESRFLTESGLIPNILSSPPVSSAIVLSLLCVTGALLIDRKTVLGFNIRAVGMNREAALYAGIKPRKTILLACVVSGGLAGLAGMVQVSAVFFTLRTDISTNYGYLGVPIALLGNMDPLGVLFSAFLFAALVSGSTLMQTMTQVSSVFVQVVEGLIILAIAGRNLLKLVRRS